MSMYYRPADYGLETVGEIDFSSGDYEFDLTVIWRRVSDGAFVYADDSGCSCPSPFEDKGIGDLTVVRRGINGLNDIKAVLEKRDSESYYAPNSRGPAIVALLERMHGVIA